jgi:hypothetical protein
MGTLEVRSGEEKLVGNIGQAEAAAHAENPFQTTLIDEEVEKTLTPEARAAIEEISLKRADEAIAAYQEKKSLEDPRITILRDLGAKTLDISGYATELNREFANKVQDPFGSVDKLLKSFSGARLDRIIADPKLTPAEKKKQIEEIGYDLRGGVFRTFHLQTKRVDEYAQNVVNKLHDRLSDPGSAQRTEHEAQGYLLTHLAAGDPISALRVIGAVGLTKPNQKFAELIKEYLPMITAARKESGRFARFNRFDEAMAQKGFVWSPGTGEYINFDE